MTTHIFDSASQEETVCERQSSTISCPGNQVVRINTATYGRLSKVICKRSDTSNTNCRANGVQSKVSSYCNGKSSCVLEAKNEIFGDPCFGIYKYLQVSFTCIGEYFPHSFRTILYDHFTLLLHDSPGSPFTIARCIQQYKSICSPLYN